MSGVALAGLVLTLVALVGGLVEGVRSRTRELAVRLAVGASQGRMVLLVASEGLLIVALGAILGLGGGIIAGHSLASIFHGGSGIDLRAASVVIGLFCLIAMVATTKAALMACRVNPAVALKNE
jgi:putative ABC transport system permease protein